MSAASIPLTSSTESSAVLALIPARGGSKGIPGKNLQTLAGKPLLAHSLEQALASKRIHRVVVSTDDGEIARVAREWGAEVVERPAELSGDEASSESALVHALDHLRTTEGYEPELVVFLQATSPLRPPGTLDQAIHTLEAGGADSLFSAALVHGFVWRRDEAHLRALTYEPGARPRRQDIGEDLLENGSIYIFRPHVLRDHGHRLGGKVAVYPMDPLDSFQIDEPGDLERMEKLLAIRPAPLAVQNLSELRLVVFDFDGVFTDSRVWVSQDGSEAVACHRGDGLGLEMLRRAGFSVVVLSKEKNPVVAQRCKKLGLECHHGRDDKLPDLKKIAAERGLGRHQVAYVGNDVNDLECLAWAGLGIAVADAEPAALGAADVATVRRGGHGAVREVCDAFLAQR